MMFSAMLFGLTLGRLTSKSKQPLDDDTIQTAVSDWCEGGDKRFATESTYGLIMEWDTSKVTSMRGLFQDKTTCDPDISGWNTGAVTDMSMMFQDARNFNKPIGNWDTSAVTSMGFMFYNADKFNQPINNWDTSKVRTMEWMFSFARTFNQPIGNWSTANVALMGRMFYGANMFNQSLCWTLQDQPSRDTSVFVRTSCPPLSLYNQEGINFPRNCWGAGTPINCSPIRATLRPTAQPTAAPTPHPTTRQCSSLGEKCRWGTVGDCCDGLYCDSFPLCEGRGYHCPCIRLPNTPPPST